MDGLDIDWLRFKLTWGELFPNENDIMMVGNNAKSKNSNCNKADTNNCSEQVCQHPKEYRRFITSRDQYCAKCDKYI